MTDYRNVYMAVRIMRGIVHESQLIERRDKDWSYINLGCLDAPAYIPAGSHAALSSSRSALAVRGQWYEWRDEAAEAAAARDQFGPAREELLILVYRLGVVNRCRQYTFQSVGEFLNWAGGKPYSGEVLEVMVSIGGRMVGSVFIRPGMASVAMANFQRWHVGRVAA